VEGNEEWKGMRSGRDVLRRIVIRRNMLRKGDRRE